MSDSDSFDLSRERDILISSSSSHFPDWKINDESVREEKKEERDTLSLPNKFAQIFGGHWSDFIELDLDRIILKKNAKLLDFIHQIKVYSPKRIIEYYLPELRISSKTLYKVQSILVKYNMIGMTKWTGKAKATFGLTLYFTFDATPKHFENYLREDVIRDELRYEKQIQRKLKKKSPDQIKEEMKEKWSAQSEAAKELKQAEKQEEEKEQKEQQNKNHVQNWAKVPLRVRRNHIATCELCRREAKK